MSYIVNTTGWQVVMEDGLRKLELNEPLPADVQGAIGDLEPWLDGGYIRPVEGTARAAVSPITGHPVADAALPTEPTPEPSQPAAE